MNEKFEMQNSPEATCDCCTWDVVLTRVLSTSCYIYSPRCHLLERTALRISSFFPQSDRIRPLSPFRSIFPSDRSLFFFFFFLSTIQNTNDSTARSFTVLTSVPFLFPFFHDPPVIFQRAATTTGNSPDGDGGPTSTDKRFTNTSTAGDISLLNYAG